MDQNPEPPVVDETILDGYRVLQDDGQPDIITEFIDIFLEDLPARAAAIRSAVEAQDSDLIRSTAHALKGSAASIGAAQLASICDALETIGRTGNPAGSADVFWKLEPAVEAARAGLMAYRG